MQKDTLFAQAACQLCTRAKSPPAPTEDGTTLGPAGSLSRLHPSPPSTRLQHFELGLVVVALGDGGIIGDVLDGAGGEALARGLGGAHTDAVLGSAGAGHGGDTCSGSRQPFNSL